MSIVTDLVSLNFPYVTGWNLSDAILFMPLDYVLHIDTISMELSRLAQVLKTFFHQCVISYTCSQSNSDGSVLSLKTEPSELDWLQVYEMTL